MRLPLGGMVLPKQVRADLPARLAWSVLSCLPLLLGGSAPAHAVDYPVTKTEDTNDGACGADCSLREAIVAANNHPGADTITLQADRYTLSIAGSGEDLGATGDLDITDLVTLSGQGREATVIDATGLGDRVLHIHVGSGEIKFENLTLTGGSTDFYGGGVNNYGADLTLDNVAVVGNGSYGSGGGVYSGWAGEVTIENGSVISNNSVSGPHAGGGVGVARLTMTDSTVTGNSAGAGGGVAAGMDGGTVTIAGSTISDNWDLGYDGGGIYIHDVSADVTIENCTVHGNASARQGGGLWVGASATVSLNSVTLTGNTSAFASSAIFNNGQLNLSNTLVQGACSGSGTAISAGGNLESPGTTCALTGPGDMDDVADPMLGPLYMNGGPTSTRLPLLGSSAIDNGTVSDCPAVDQRGEARNVGPCDIGAVERQLDDHDLVFFDGFESGDTDAWSGTVPGP